MSTHFSTSTRLDRLNRSSSNENDEDSVVSTASSFSDADIEDGEISKEAKASTPSEKKGAEIEANKKPSCPSTVNHIVNALSAVGTFGGLALIITGGMGITLNKPIDNTMENIAMVLSGSALLVGSWVGNVAYANYQPA